MMLHHEISSDGSMEINLDLWEIIEPLIPLLKEMQKIEQLADNPEHKIKIDEKTEPEG